MDADFDPYHLWLSIPPAEQPAHHYRLLGLELFEANPDVIDIAANRLSSWVRMEAAKGRQKVGRKLLRQIDVARTILLHPESKSKYDTGLTKQGKSPAAQEQSTPSDRFDPYHNWLGIAPAEQPATHYRLLGLTEFEEHPEVITAAASRQSAYLHTAATGAHRRESQQLLNEVAKARLTLLDDKQRAAYDRSLRKKRHKERESKLSLEVGDGLGLLEKESPRSSTDSLQLRERKSRRPTETSLGVLDAENNHGVEELSPATRNTSRLTQFQLRVLGSSAAALLIIAMLSFAFRRGSNDQKPDNNIADTTPVIKEEVRHEDTPPDGKDTSQQPPAGSKATEYHALVKGSFQHQATAIEEDGLPFWLSGEPTMLKSQRRYPLVIVLHQLRKDAKTDALPGPQEMAKAWTVQPGMQKTFPCFVVQPYLGKNVNWQTARQQLDATLLGLFESLPIDRNRVYLFGYGNGGKAAFEALVRRPNWYAASVIVSSYSPVSQLKGKLKSPVWMWIGSQDKATNARGRVPKLKKALKATGLDVRLTVVPEVGFNCQNTAATSQEVRKWLFAQRRPPTATEEKNSVGQSKQAGQQQPQRKSDENTTD